MSAFNPTRVLAQFVPEPLGEDTRDTELPDQYHRIVPYHLADYTRNFYFEVHLVEIPFESPFPGHPDKTTISFPATTLELQKTVQLLDGSELQLPILPFYIFVNRTLFHPKRPEENEIEWLLTLPLRTRGIAHELLIAEQYAQHFDVATRMMPRAISIPDPASENEVMCPFSVIERALSTIEDNPVGKVFESTSAASRALGFSYNRCALAFSSSGGDLITISRTTPAGACQVILSRTLKKV